MMQNFYPTLPENLELAAQQVVKFLNRGDDVVPTEGGVGRLYSFQKDSGLIYAAFQQTHGIDLAKGQMHWWKFLTLFLDLGSTTTFCELVSLRRRLKTGKATKEERQAAREMGDLIEVPETEVLTAEEQAAEDEFMRLMQGAK